MTLFIGIDLGTSGCRAIVIDEHGNCQGNAVTPLPEPQRNGHEVEQDAALWWDAVCTCLAELTANINSSEVAAIAVDGTSGTLLLTDENGTALLPALMYNDARAIRQAEHIAKIAPANTAAQGASCTLAKLLWLFAERTHVDRKILNAQHAMHQADWITGRLCGQFGTSDYNNALKLGFDAEQKVWPPWIKALLNDANIPDDILPNVIAPGTTVGKISPDIAKQFKLPTSTQVVAGTTDSTASFMATGANKKGEAVTALGSTLVLKIISDKPVFSQEHGVYSQPLLHTGSEQWLVGGGSNSGGAVLRQYFSTEQLLAMTPQLKPETPTGLNYYPLPATGERFPINDCRLKPQMEPRPENDAVFFQAILEGIAHIEAKGYQLLSELGAPYPVSIRTTGGGANNRQWEKIRAAQLNCELIQAHHTEAAYGAALLAKSGLS